MNRVADTRTGLTRLASPTSGRGFSGLGLGSGLPNPNPDPRQIVLFRSARIAITKWMLRLTTLEGGY